MIFLSAVGLALSDMLNNNIRTELTTFALLNCRHFNVLPSIYRYK